MYFPGSACRCLQQVAGATALQLARRAPNVMLGRALEKKLLVLGPQPSLRQSFIGFCGCDCLTLKKYM